MSGAIRICERCGREFEAKEGPGRPARYCSDRCRDRARREREREPVAPDVPPAPRHVSDADLAGAVLQARGAQATFDAGRRSGPPTLRPMCDRIAEGIGRVLDREGL
jgi:hypothetical protein